MARRTRDPARYFALDDRWVNANRTEVAIPSGRRVWLRPRDVVVLFSRSHRGARFHGLGRLEAAEGDGEPGVFRARLADYEGFDVAELEEFSFSLDVVKNTAEPFRHFTRPYRGLSAHDVNALAEGRVFWARTAIGMFLREVPAETLPGIVGAIVGRNPAARRDLRAAWTALRQILERDFIELARVGVALAANIDTLDRQSEDASEPRARDGARFRDLRLHDPDGVQAEGRGTDTGFYAHRAAFARVVAAFQVREEGEPSLLDALTAVVSEEAPREQDAERRFRGRLWPVEVVA